MKCILCANEAQQDCDSLCGSCYMALDAGTITAIGVAIEAGKRIAELERMLSDASAVIEDYSGLIDEKREKVAELFNQVVSLSLQLNAESTIAHEAGARVAELEANLRHAMTHEATLYGYVQERDARIADLQAQVATLQIDVADWGAIADERGKIADIAVQRYNAVVAPQ